MGILNVTPDSFFDGGKHYQSSAQQSLTLDSAIRSAEQMVAQGAAFVDVGGESTRPGASPVSVQQECDRVLPVVEALAARVDAVISVDTSTPLVMVESSKLGAGLINDVRALEREGALSAAISTELPICLMHMQGNPRSMQDNPAYDQVVDDVKVYLSQRIACVQKAAAGLGKLAPQIILDPGFGFGKTDEHNLALLRGLPLLLKPGVPLLVGLSRKSMIGRLLGRNVENRLPGSLALAMLAVQNGARIVRVHDVAETLDVIKILELTLIGEQVNGA